MMQRLILVCLMGVGLSLPAYAANRAPTISGTPQTWAYVGSQYSFKALGRDPEGAKLRYLISNKPAWATFNTSTGVLSGTPTAVGFWGGIQIRVSDGVSTSTALSFSIRASSLNNVAPRISGTPARSATPGALYSFTPSASDANRDPLRFTISNRPAWASFDTRTGKLSGTPTAANAGNYSNIVIAVTDGATTVALAPFSITVADAWSNAALLEWLPPTDHTDGSALTNLAGYRIVYGVSATKLTQTIKIANPGISSYVVENLVPGTYYFAVRAYTSNGIESANSNVVAKVVR